MFINSNLIGNIPNWPKIKNCKKHKLKIIEDSADTLGAKIGSRTTGFIVISSNKFLWFPRYKLRWKQWLLLN